ncbi:restriction endonuclease [Cupriavidus respiraculi]|uniref:restriction endonuclease n=1 Tax=Cupriavidus respiraculi TaxID=195930 RepID=UPI001C98AD7B|nr:restriction endonuclease [Cupriavidus respiraculi]MBY4947262.1 restriction endonuclease [Cupriavidus respiraculi]
MGNEKGLLQKAMDAAAQLLEAGQSIRAKEDAALATRAVILKQFERPEVSTAEFSLPLLRSLSWNRFEQLCGAYFSSHGFRVDQKSHGADGGVDIRLYFRDLPSPVKLIQCKGWRRTRVDVDHIRALRGVMAREGVKEGVFVTMSTFIRPAMEEAVGGKIMTLDGAGFIERLQTLDAARKESLLQVATEGEFWRPHCVRCGIPMNPISKTERPFWGCPNFARTRCKSKISLTSAFK